MELSDIESLKIENDLLKRENDLLKNNIQLPDDKKYELVKNAFYEEYNYYTPVNKSNANNTSNYKPAFTSIHDSLRTEQIKCELLRSQNKRY